VCINEYGTCLSSCGKSTISIIKGIKDFLSDFYFLGGALKFLSKAALAALAKGVLWSIIAIWGISIGCGISCEKSFNRCVSDAWYKWNPLGV
jgi:hypothetical protein